MLAAPGLAPQAALATDLGKRGRLAVYDWEPAVIGPSGRPELASGPLPVRLVLRSVTRLPAGG